MSEFLTGFTYFLIRYALLAGGAYLIFWKLLRVKLSRRKIQNLPLKKHQIKIELLLSGVTLVLYSANILLSKVLDQQGWTLFYEDIDSNGMAYYVFSIWWILICHDSYFYWTHRLLHTKWFFEKVHYVHHYSESPTPFSILSFHPIEACIHVSFLAIVTSLFPFHWSVVLTFTMVSFIVNILGHLGFEFFPVGFSRHKIIGLCNTPTYHYVHHRTIDCNFGIYSGIWDRLMGTQHPNYHEIYDQAARRDRNIEDIEAEFHKLI